MGSKIGGRIDNVLVREDDRVQPGQVLITLRRQGVASFCCVSLVAAALNCKGEHVRSLLNNFACSLVALALVCAAIPTLAGDKTTWNYEGGLFVITNGSIPKGPCFRLAGRVTSGDFFDHLKRIDKESGTIFRHGSETVEKFPDRLTLSFLVHDHYDQTCPPHEENSDAPKYLTRAMMSSLHLFLYWKRGVELRPVENVERKYFAVREIIPEAVAQAHGLPQKLEWAYEYVVPSAGVPLTDSLVLVLRDEENRIVARVAARL